MYKEHGIHNLPYFEFVELTLFRQPVACLGTFAFANEASFFHETAEEPYNTIVCQCLFEGDGNVFCVMVFCREQSVEVTA